LWLLGGGDTNNSHTFFNKESVAKKITQKRHKFPGTS
jgi:hypothetical protein